LEGDDLEGVSAAFSFFDGIAGTAEAIDVLFERGAPRIAGEEPGPLLGICMIDLLDIFPSDPTRCSESTGTRWISFVFRVLLLVCSFVATVALEGDGSEVIFSSFDGIAENGEAIEASFGRGASGITGSWKEGPFPFVAIGLLG
jgi:hypothetical protein